MGIDLFLTAYQTSVLMRVGNELGFAEGDVISPNHEAAAAALLLVAAMVPRERRYRPCGPPSVTLRALVDFDDEVELSVYVRSPLIYSGEASFGLSDGQAVQFKQALATWDSLRHTRASGMRSARKTKTVVMP